MIITDGKHLVSTESLAELHEFAMRKLGFQPDWLHVPRSRIPHYDLTTDRARQRAINAGALRVTSKKIIREAYRLPK